VEPIITYPAGDTIPPITKYPIRCYSCLKKLASKGKESGKDKEKKQLVSSSYFPPTISAKLKRYRDKKKAMKVCVNCPTPLEPIIIYPAGDKVPPIIKYPVHCYKCRKINNVRDRIYRKKRFVTIT